MMRQALGSKFKWTIFISLILLSGLFLISPSKATASELVTTDYYINHQSIEPVYTDNKLDPSVLIHLREVVLAGRERTAPKEGKILLFLHGYSTPGYIAFDLDHENCSMMRYFAREGWDTFALDYEGHGLSTDPPSIDFPSLFPNSKAPIHSDVAISDVERVFAFIQALRGVKKVHILGWSLGASRTGPIFTIRHPESVSRLVLFAPGYKNLGFAERARKSADVLDNRVKVRLSHPSLAGWYVFGSNKDIIVPGAFEAFRETDLASDPKSGELGGSVRIPQGRLVDLLRANPQFDASKITVPTLVVRGSLDTFSISEDCKNLTDDLGADFKKFVEIPDASHMIPYEKSNVIFFKAVKDFLEAKIEKPKSQ